MNWREREMNARVLRYAKPAMAGGRWRIQIQIPTLRGALKLIACIALSFFTAITSVAIAADSKSRNLDGSVWFRSVQPHLHMPDGGEPDTRRGRFLFFNYSERALTDFDTGENIYKDVDTSDPTYENYRTDGWKKIIHKSETSGRIVLWSCGPPCDGTAAGSFSWRDASVRLGDGRLVKIGAKHFPLTFAGRPLEIEISSDQGRITYFTVITAADELGKPLWNKVMLLQSEGRGESPRGYLGPKNPIVNSTHSIAVFPGVDWMFVEMSGSGGAEFNSITARLDLRSGHPLVPHRRLRLVDADELQSLLAKVLQPLEADARFVQELLDDQGRGLPGEAPLIATGPQATRLYSAIFSAIKKTYFEGVNP